MSKSIASIILCAGKGRRMQAPTMPKVCFPVVGKPAIAHMLERLGSLSISPNVLVVGHLAGMVIDEIGPRFPDAVFLHQGELLGTGHATRQGASLLQRMGFNGSILVIAGDKVVEARALEKLMRVFHAEKADMALMVAPKDRWPRAGRIVTRPDGGVARIIECADIEQARKTGRKLDAAGIELTADKLESRVVWVNQAVYLYRAPALYNSLTQLTRDNAQREEYLTDTVEAIVRGGGRVVPAPVDDPEDVMGFNNPAELLEIEEHFRKKAGLVAATPTALDPRIFKSPGDWAERLSRTGGELDALLRGIYGEHPQLREEKRKRLLRTVEEFIERFGRDGRIAVIRAPGRINLMGRHVDHRGGRVNLLAIDREHIVVARARNDGRVRARNSDAEQFNDVEFTVDDLLEHLKLDDWRGFVDSAAVLKMVRDLQGDWSNYLKAPLLRLQQRYKDRHIRGVDCLVSGDIPMAAGLSSSSALVVSMAEALVLTNGLDVSPHDLVDVCGEGEWFVGTRGGSADHAAIKLSQPGQVAHVGFFPFTIHDFVDFPADYALVIANSRIQARKAAGARDAFNERVASYELAVHWVRKRFPNFAPLIHHLRDISPETLGVRPADIYRVLLDVPESIDIEELRAELGGKLVASVVNNHAPSKQYALRGRLLFGIAECERAKRCFQLLRDGDLESLGWLMNVSHDGDRVEAPDGSPFVLPLGDARIEGLMHDLQSEDPERVLAAQIYAQPGAYACSIPAIDRMADIATATPGVLGAQLSGAGLGGCMMILVRKDAADAVISQLDRTYYAPNQLEPGALAITPIAGCSALAMG